MNSPTEAEFIDYWREVRPNVIDGFIKLKLVHAEGASLFVPDLLAANLGGMRWFQPKFFYAPQLFFMDGFSVATIGIEVSGGLLLRVAFTSGGFMANLRDSSQVYRCMISAPADLMPCAVGTCSLELSGDFLLDLFHHTTTQAAEAIQSSGHFRGSSWNVQGTRQLKNVAYAYFTSLQKISSATDLAKIAMSPTGYVKLLRTNAESTKEAIPLKVYRQSTFDRTAIVPIKVPASLVASQHVYLHPARGQVFFYEICNPDIYRVGLRPGKIAPIVDCVLDVPDTDRKRFEYVVLGNADTETGLIAPYDEEETKSLLHIEACTEQTLFDFWFNHANSNQVADRVPELLIFKNGDEAGT